MIVTFGAGGAYCIGGGGLYAAPDSPLINPPAALPMPPNMSPKPCVPAPAYELVEA